MSSAWIRTTDGSEMQISSSQWTYYHSSSHRVLVGACQEVKSLFKAEETQLRVMLWTNRALSTSWGLRTSDYRHEGKEGCHLTNHASYGFVGTGFSLIVRMQWVSPKIDLVYLVTGQLQMRTWLLTSINVSWKTYWWTKISYRNARLSCLDGNHVVHI